MKQSKQRGVEEFRMACVTFVQDRQPLTPPPARDRLICDCGNCHFIVTRVDFTCTQCFRSYRD